jgi:DNA-directed RNA polymerase subunit RPC12/RpoP
MTKKPFQKAPYLCLKCNTIMEYREAGKIGQKEEVIKCPNTDCGQMVFMNKILRNMVEENIEELLGV